MAQQRLNRHFYLKTVVHLLALAPLADLCWRFYDVYSNGSEALGAEPVVEIEHTLGLWALRFLMLTLAITPLRQLTHLNALIRYRRLIGLYAFFYACLHFLVYLVLDLGSYWTLIFEDIAKRPYITIGFSAWLLLLPLAVTSTKKWMLRLGRKWAKLHMLIYPAALCAVLHFYWLVKSDTREPLLYAGILGVLLLWRIGYRLKRRATHVHTATTAPEPRK